MKKMKVYSINFCDTWCKMIKAKSKKEAIQVFKDYSGTHPSFWDKKYKVKLMTHPSWYEDEEWLKTPGIYSGEGAKRAKTSKNFK